MITFNNQITVIEPSNRAVPQFVFNMDNGVRVATYESPIPTLDGLQFVYTIVEGDVDSDGISWFANSISLPEGVAMVHPQVQQFNAGLDHEGQGPVETVRVNRPIPVIESITLDGYANEDGSENYNPVNGYYTGTGDDIDVYIYVTFSSDVAITGAPTFEFEMGGETRTATFLFAEGRNLEFSYAIQADDPDDADGISWGANALTGTFHDATRTHLAADISHDAQAPVATNKVAIPPMITGITVIRDEPNNQGLIANLGNANFAPSTPRFPSWLISIVR